MPEDFIHSLDRLNHEILAMDPFDPRRFGALWALREVNGILDQTNAKDNS